MLLVVMVDHRGDVVEPVGVGGGVKLCRQEAGHVVGQFALFKKAVQRVFVYQQQIVGRADLHHWVFRGLRHRVHGEVSQVQGL